MCQKTFGNSDISNKLLIHQNNTVCKKMLENQYLLYYDFKKSHVLL